jgi:dTDP-4-dehydrorhamnose 3,5-epimerase
MKFIETELSGAFIIRPELAKDARGFFARVFCQREFREQGLHASLVQCNISFNREKDTLRGMHYQVAPHREAKLVRCTSGAIFDVIVDLRSDSPTFRKWLGVELSAEHRTMLYVPERFAHGYLTLTGNTEVFYQVSEFYAPSGERGVRWNDPAFGIRWPASPRVISDKDAGHPDFAP